MNASKFLATAKNADSVGGWLLSISIILVLSGAACRTEEEVKNTDVAQPSPTVAAKKTDDFEESLAAVRTGNFAFVYAFRRPDGDVFSSDDKKFVKANAPVDTNQWVLTADGKCVIAGSNYKFMPDQLAALKKRFNVEDYSPSAGDNSGNQNANVPVAKTPELKSANQNTANTK